MRERVGLGANELARRIGTSSAQISRLENGSRRLTYKWAAKIADVLHCEPEDLVSAATDEWAYDATQALKKMDAAFALPPSGQNMVPVYGQASCGPDGQFELNGQIVDHQPRPGSLEKVREAYALYIEGSSMFPRYKDGEIVFVHPGRKPRVGSDVVVQLHPLEDGEPPRAFIKEYVSGDMASVTLRQYGDDPRDFSISREQVLSVHVIVARGEPA